MSLKPNKDHITSPAVVLTVIPPWSQMTALEEEEEEEEEEEDPSVGPEI